MNGISKVAFSVRAAHNNKVSLSRYHHSLTLHPEPGATLERVRAVGTIRDQSRKSHPRLDRWTAPLAIGRSAELLSLFFSSSGLGRFARLAE